MKPFYQLTPAERRQYAIDKLDAAYQELQEELCCDGDSMVTAFAKAPPHDSPLTGKRAELAAKVGFLYAIVKRNEMRSDNAV